MFSCIRRLWNRVDLKGTPDNPMGVRLYLVAHLWICSFLLIFFKPPHWQNDIALIGLFIGTIGAGIVYWESILKEEAIANITVQWAGATGHFGRGDIVAILLNAAAGAVVFFEAFKQGKNIILAILFSSIFPIASAIVLKVAARWRGKRSEKLSVGNYNKNRDHISRSYKLGGLLTIIAGAACQIPLILKG